MSKLETIMACYNKALSIESTHEADTIKAKFELENILLSSNDIEVLEFHYNCLGDTKNETIYFTCRAAFAKRPHIETFLLSKLEVEQDKHKIADIIHILGRIRSDKALEIAKYNLLDKDDHIREVCLYVIGWTGSISEINVLSYYLMNEPTQKLRITAGSALRQIAWRIKESKADVLDVLKEAFYHESDKTVLARIIELISTIAIKNLGIREDKDNPNILLGDLDKAIAKTKKFFETYTHTGP
jgi:hypothetical protein